MLEAVDNLKMLVRESEVRVVDDAVAISPHHMEQRVGQSINSFTWDISFVDQLYTFESMLYGFRLRISCQRAFSHHPCHLAAESGTLDPSDTSR